VAEDSPPGRLASPVPLPVLLTDFPDKAIVILAFRAGCRVPMAESRQVALIDAPTQAMSLADPVRRRILEVLREPMSATGVARRLRLPRQRVAYYVADLRKQRLLRTVGTRKKGNFTERLLQTTARAFVIAPQALGALGADPTELRDRFSSAYLAAVASRVLRDLSELERGARAAKKTLPTLTLQSEVRFASPAEQHAFAEELAACLTTLVARYHDDACERGRRFQLVIAGYPSPATPTDRSTT
jgi:DNA-binding transcriptional ArsR family regulator